VAAVEFEDPLGGVVEEVTVVGHGHHGAGETQQVLLQPLHGFGVEVVGGFVEQQHVGLRQQQLAQRDATLLAAGEVLDRGIPGRQAQRVGGDFELGFAVGARGGDDGFQPRLLLGELVEVGILFRVGGIHGFELGLGFHDLAHAGFDLLAHGLGRVELRLLRQVADAQVRQVLHLALELGVGLGHDAQHGRLAGTVEAEQADLGAGEEGQRDVLDDLALRGDDLAHAEHGHYVLGHVFRIR
jgi:hypothetical protein